MLGQSLSLELINGVVTINTFFFLMWCTIHLYSEFRRRALTWWFALVGLPSVAIVAAMFGEKFGLLATRSVIWIWRSRGGKDSFTEIENWLLFGGAFLTSMCLLWSIAILSRLRFGEWPWRIAALITIGYVVLAFWLHY